MEQNVYILLTCRVVPVCKRNHRCSMFCNTHTAQQFPKEKHLIVFINGSCRCLRWISGINVACSHVTMLIQLPWTPLAPLAQSKTNWLSGFLTNDLKKILRAGWVGSQTRLACHSEPKRKSIMERSEQSNTTLCFHTSMFCYSFCTSVGLLTLCDELSHLAKLQKRKSFQSVSQPPFSWDENMKRQQKM